MPVPGALERVRAAMEGLRRSFRQHFAYIDQNESASHALFGDMLRQYESSPSWAKLVAHDAIHEIVGELDRGEFETFTRVLVLQDLQESLDEGLYDLDAPGPDGETTREIPFGYTREKLKSDLAHFRALAEPNEKITRVIERRRTLARQQTERLIELELPSPRCSIAQARVMQWRESGRGDDSVVTGQGFSRSKPPRTWPPVSSPRSRSCVGMKKNTIMSGENWDADRL